MQQFDEGTSTCLDDEEEEPDTEEEEDLVDLDTARRIDWVKENIEEPRREGEKRRAQFLATAHLQPPQVLRVIDIDSTCSRRHVTLLDYRNVQDLARGYSAISHTFGLDVYSVFDCQCASDFSSNNASVPPRCRDHPCLHNITGKCKDQRDKVVNDILGMCHILRKAGVAYAWHDGVCIAQHNDKELTATIESMGWIYSMAQETIVFLHYVGKPMAPVSPRGSECELVCRWHTRVWTLQEAALSKKRRYCVRVCNPPPRFQSSYRSCNTLKKLVRKFKEFEEAIALWYSFESSEIDVITEERFMVDFIQEAEDVSCHLRLAAQRLKERNYSMWSASNDALGLDCWYAVINSWYSCLTRLKDTLQQTCLGFPTLGAALFNCSRRDSKHMGDRVNSVLTLAGLRGFVAPKDFQEGNDTMEGWTIEFFNQQGQGGLAWALFCLNVGRPKVDDDMLRTRTWVPMLWRPIREHAIVGISDCTKSWGIKFKVCQDKRLQLEGELECISLSSRSS
ncbi:hypothetical protein L7F22_031360 [Adiantum nelumboides]|nr:hypothetical protein [Adiantum nelumboides]